jgi:hypothetical protein
MNIDLEKDAVDQTEHERPGHNSEVPEVPTQLDYLPEIDRRLIFSKLAIPY